MKKIILGEVPFESKQKKLEIELSKETNQKEFTEQVKTTFISKKKTLPIKFYKLEKSFKKVLGAGDKKIKKIFSEIKVNKKKKSKLPVFELKEDLVYENLCFTNYKEFLNLVDEVVKYFTNKFELKHFLYLNKANQFVLNQLNLLIYKHQVDLESFEIVENINSNYKIVSEYSFENLKGRISFLSRCLPFRTEDGQSIEGPQGGNQGVSGHQEGLRAGHFK